MDIKFNFVKQKVQKWVIEVEYVASQKELEDILTTLLCKNNNYLVNQVQPEVLREGVEGVMLLILTL